VRIVIDVASDRLADELVDLLERAGHVLVRGSVVTCPPYDLALVGTPELAERVKHDRPHAAVVVVTKVGDVPARVRALEVGADDTFDRSFPPMQSMARVVGAARRVAMVPRPSEQFDIDGCVIDLSASTASRAGLAHQLTAREVEIIRYLVQHTGQVVSRAELLQNVWRVAAGNETRAVDVAMVGLRGKLERDPSNPVIIQSIRGQGYRWGALTLR
jgi:DNA-binding response OmpR family regulator